MSYTLVLHDISYGDFIETGAIRLTHGHAARVPVCLLSSRSQR